MVKVVEYTFGARTFQLCEDRQAGQRASRSSELLASVLPDMKGQRVLDLGCGTGYMTMAALLLGASSVVGVDTAEVGELVTRTVRLNGFTESQFEFKHGAYYEEIDADSRFDVIVANMPQHALPSTPEAKQLDGKYGGCDGTEAVVKAITEGANFLHPGGVYCGAVSELTNYHRTLSLAGMNYEIMVKRTVTKELRTEEMEPHISDENLRVHLGKLLDEGLVDYVEDNSKIQYQVHLCHFVRR